VVRKVFLDGDADKSESECETQAMNVSSESRTKQFNRSAQTP